MNKRNLLANKLDKILETYDKKNADYGDSVGDTYKKFGDISFLVRITDKYNRINQLINHKNKVKDESIEDTILDLANYCLLWLVEREQKSHKTSRVVPTPASNIDVRLIKRPCTDEQIVSDIQAELSRKLMTFTLKDLERLVDIVKDIGGDCQVWVQSVNGDSVNGELVADSVASLNKAIDMCNRIDSF